MTWSDELSQTVRHDFDINDDGHLSRDSPIKSTFLTSLPSCYEKMYPVPCLIGKLQYGSPKNRRRKGYHENRAYVRRRKFAIFPKNATYYLHSHNFRGQNSLVGGFSANTADNCISNSFVACNNQPLFSLTEHPPHAANSLLYRK